MNIDLRFVKMMASGAFLPDCMTLPVNIVDLGMHSAKKLLMILLSVCICMKAKAQLTVGEKLPGEIKIVNKSKYILSGPGSIEKASTVMYNGYTYDVILKTNGVVKSIFTTDKGFLTPESVKVGMSLRQLMPGLTDTIGHLYPGWAKWYITKSGWNVAFDFEHAVVDTSTVKFIFKN